MEHKAITEVEKTDTDIIIHIDISLSYNLIKKESLQSVYDLVFDNIHAAALDAALLQKFSGIE